MGPETRSEPKDRLWARVPMSLSIAVRRFAKDQGVPVTLAVRILLMASPPLDKYLREP